MDCEVKGKLIEMEAKGEKACERQYCSMEELIKRETYRLKMLQEDSYPSELKSLLLNDNVRKRSTLVPLNPALNNQSLIYLFFCE